MECQAGTCALCGKTLGDAELAHAVRDKVVCEACRRLVSACEPRRVLPYADGAVRPRRRWLWPALAAFVAVAILMAALLLMAERARAERARAEQMRALAAEAARAAAAASAGPATTLPTE